MSNEIHNVEPIVKSVVYQLVTISRIFDSLGREEDARASLDIAFDVQGLLPLPE